MLELSVLQTDRLILKVSGENSQTGVSLADGVEERLTDVLSRLLTATGVVIFWILFEKQSLFKSLLYI